MSDSTASLRRKIESAQDLQSVVRTMKSLAASSIGQYEDSVRALGDYYRTVELGLAASFRESRGQPLDVPVKGASNKGITGAIVFGSDQGLVGQFNEAVVDYAIKSLAGLSGRVRIWAIGDRLCERLENAGLPLAGRFALPTSVQGIAVVVGQIQIDTDKDQELGSYERLLVFHNRPESRSLYEPAVEQLLPLDANWQKGLSAINWPTKILPEVLCDGNATLRSLIREYLFITVFRACAESLASENISRLAAMERADKNIQELLVNLQSTFHRVRQERIDEELFDVISGFEAISGLRLR